MLKQPMKKQIIRIVLIIRDKKYRIIQFELYGTLINCYLEIMNNCNLNTDNMNTLKFINPETKNSNGKTP